MTSKLDILNGANALTCSYCYVVVYGTGGNFRKVNKNLPFYFISFNSIRVGRCTSLWRFRLCATTFTRNSMPAALAELSRAHACGVPALSFTSFMTAHYTSLRSLYRPCPSLNYVRSGVPFSFGIPHYERSSPSHSLGSSPAAHHASSLVAALPRPQQAWLRQPTVADRLSVSALLRSLVLRALLGVQPCHYVSLPCCYAISAKFFERGLYVLLTIFVYMIILHSLYTVELLSPL